MNISPNTKPVQTSRVNWILVWLYFGAIFGLMLAAHLYAGGF